jgi:hypothetical protein
LIPDGIVLSVDAAAFGSLKIKHAFDITVEDIPIAERDRIRLEAPVLANANFDEKVRIIGYEVVKPAVERNAFTVVRRSDVPFTLKTFT